MKRDKSTIIAVLTASVGLIFGVAISTQFRPAPDSSTAPVASTTQTPNTATPLSSNQTGVQNPSSSSSQGRVSARADDANAAGLGNHSAETSSATKKTSIPLQAPPNEPYIAPIGKAAPTHKSRALPDNAPVVCVDPGHPSEVSDGANAHGLSENKLNWQVALKIQQRLEAMSIRCILTKEHEKHYRTNRQRAEIANDAGVAVLVRLHCDVGSGRGYTWYYPDRSGSKGGVTGPSKTVQENSRRAAYIINETMKPVLKGHLQSNEIKTDASTFVGGKQGGVLTGSIFARVPTALIEMCYINQKNDALFIASQAGQEKMAEALSLGIYAYVYQ